MTFAPQALLDARTYLKPLTGLDSIELGITPDENHHGGYHCGWDQRRLVDGVLHDYAWQESTRDSSHKTNAARALDVGNFPRLRELSIWIVQQCQAGAPDTADIREVIYSPDGLVVKRWDRLGKRSSGDDSHLTHTHISFFADAETHDKTALFRRFFERTNVTTIDQVGEWAKNTHAGIFYGGTSCGDKLPDGKTSLFAKVDYQRKLSEAHTAKLDAIAAKSPTALTPEQVSLIAAEVIAQLRPMVREELDKTKLGS